MYQLNWIELSWNCISSVIDFSHLKWNNDDYLADQYFQLEFHEEIVIEEIERDSMWFVGLFNFYFSNWLSFEVEIEKVNLTHLLNRCYLNTKICKQRRLCHLQGNFDLFDLAGIAFIVASVVHLNFSQKWDQFCRRRDSSKKRSNPFDFVGFPFDSVNDNGTIQNDVAHITWKRKFNFKEKERLAQHTPYVAVGVIYRI